MRSFLFLLFSILSVFNQTALALELKDLKEEALSPFASEAVRNTVLIGTGLTAVLALTQKQIGDPFGKAQYEARPLGEFSKYGDYAGQWVPNLAYMGYQAIQGYYRDHKGYDRALGMFKATVYSSLVTTGLKYTVRSPRPNDPRTRNSFPSGHSTTVFAFSGFVLSEHGPVMGSMAMALALFSGYSRIHDQKHRLHEVVAGATIGLGYGLGISILNKNKSKESDSISLVPILEPGTKGLALYREF